MKRTNFIWRMIHTFLLVAILIIGIMILLKKNPCCDEKENVSANQGKIPTLRTSEVYDSDGNRGTLVSIAFVEEKEKAETSLTIWNDCPDKEVKKAPAVVKKSPKPKKICKKEVPVVPVAPVEKKDSCQQNLNIIYANTYVPKVPRMPDTLKIELEKISLGEIARIYYQKVALPPENNGISNTTQFSYDFVPDFKIQEHIKEAKKHLIIGSALASVGALSYTGTMFCEIPTFVEYNGLSPFDPANKYYSHNIHERERLRTLRLTRGISVGVAVIGGIEVIHGIILLKNADLNIAPQKITLRYTF